MLIIYRQSDGWHLWDTSIRKDVANSNGPIVYASAAAAMALADVCRALYRVQESFRPC